MIYWEKVFVLFLVQLFLVGSGFCIVQNEVVYFKDNGVVGYIIKGQASLLAESEQSDWVEAAPLLRPEKSVYLGKRIIVQLFDPSVLKALADDFQIKKLQDLGNNSFIFEASNAMVAVETAWRISSVDGVVVSHPIIKQRLSRHWSYSPMPNDSFYQLQWNLENRSSNGLLLGAEINIRSAHSVSSGVGVDFAIADGGIDLEHPELYGRAQNMPHFNFVTLRQEGMPSSVYETHGTHVAGIVVAEKNNRRGMVGVAPEAKFASLVIFDSGGYAVSSQRLADMFQYSSNSIAVQIHCWGYDGIYLESPSAIEQAAISNALKYGRAGRGVVMIRSVGNAREQGGNANYNGYANNPLVIAVGAIRSDGRVASYSNPGSSILVCAPSGDQSLGFPGIFTTDIHGDAGISGGTNELADYVYAQTAFSGTSAAAPQIAGIVGLILSVNSNLTYRDVQQILILSSRHYDLKDPFLQTNGAGLKVSFNTGFGVPDAGLAARIAANWSNRPPSKTVFLSITNTIPIPENGLRLLVNGYNVPPELASIQALSGGLGIRVDKPTASLGLIHIAQPLQPITNNLSGKAVLAPAVGSFYEEIINNAANAGAGFVVIYNSNSNRPDERVVMNVSDFVPIPAAFISYRDGVALRALIDNAAETYYGQLRLNAATVLFNVTNSMLCEHIGVMLRTDHARRGELRITLQSPSGTVSILQRTNYDYSPIPSGWVYYSTHHFFEQSSGIWKLQVSDEVTNSAGNILSATLILSGVQIADLNKNGIDDNYEQRFNIVNANPKDDPDSDGWQNAIEQIFGTDPLTADPIFLDISQFNHTYARLSWQGSSSNRYQILFTTNLTEWIALTNLVGNFPETLFFIPSATPQNGFFRVKKITEN
ncbi:MAG: S8 family serine peptidase [Verrucomicrobiia bacterium]|jgi:subtilisin family serine protease/subtilisin-like proprotein convertase family protein